MADYRIHGASWQGPYNYEGYSGRAWSVGLEFYVNQPVYLKYAHIWRGDSRMNAAMPFTLYQVNDKNGGTPIKGGTGTIPAGTALGWATGQTNPILLTPGVRYMLRVDVVYTTYVDDSFGRGDRYASGLGNSVIFAPGASAALSGQQGSYNGPGVGYPNTADIDSDYGLDITVTDQGFPTPLQLSASGQVAKKTAATATLGLSASGEYHKRAVRSGTAQLGLRASGRAFASDSLVATATLGLSASGKVTHKASVQATATLELSASCQYYKATEIAQTATLHLSAPGMSDFYRGVADNVRDALLAKNWNYERHHFQQASQVDAEALAADVMGGLFALSIGDRERARDTIRHLRRYRVKGQVIAGGHYHNRHSLMGYKPYGSLGAQAPVASPEIIDQALTWLAEVFKGNYGEPIGDDVASLLDWHDSYISAGPSALYGAQFLGVNRTVWGPSYQRIARPELASAAWGLLAASGANLLFPADRPPRPQITDVVLSEPGVPENNRHTLFYHWAIEDDVFCSVYEPYLEYRPLHGQWTPVFEKTTEQQADRVRVGGDYQAWFTVPHPAVTTEYRMWLRSRNTLYGEWVCSNICTIFSSNSTVLPSETTFPSPTLYPQG